MLSLNIAHRYIHIFTYVRNKTLVQTSSNLYVQTNSDIYIQIFVYLYTFGSVFSCYVRKLYFIQNLNTIKISNFYFLFELKIKEFEYIRSNEGSQYIKARNFVSALVINTQYHSSIHRDVEFKIHTSPYSIIIQKKNISEPKYWILIFFFCKRVKGGTKGAEDVQDQSQPQTKRRWKMGPSLPKNRNKEQHASRIWELTSK